MPLIEGLGDEVTIIFCLVTFIVVLLIAWLSTHTRDIPFFSLIVVELTQRASLRRQLADANRQIQEHHERQQILNTGETPDGEADAVPSDAVAEDAVSSDAGPVSETGCDSPVVESDEIQNDDSVQEENMAVASSEVDTSGSGTEGTQLPRTNQLGDESKAVVDDRVELQKTEDSANVIASEICRTTNSSPALQTCNVNSQDVSVESAEDASKKPTASSPSTETVQPGVAASTGVRQRHVPSSEPPSPISSSSSSPSSSPTTTSTSTSSPSPSPTPSPNTTVVSSGTHQDLLNQSSDNQGQIRIRLKYLNDTQRLVYSNPGDTIGQFRRAHFSTELADNKLVRLIFNGQDMRNDRNTLQGYNITDNSVIHCLVTQNLQHTAQPQMDNGDGDAALGSFMLPLFALILACIWYLRITQKQYFNAVSTLSLAGVTFLFLLACASVWRGGGDREHQHME
ncbi:transmembrane and ubiquitin-like domain-containing protein 1 [Haliotis rufescens]|uniref:transmembrane and ubiquitin-like domain-containing protein 1 n=1 Tax=Haliotis rufescens TaxID=6454 RepID=UPI00201EC8DE|nr:transmembrane and ubiquitin-like domain-containing protein 1 [Haliotis rufescens]XP_048237910.1 transmembrane and ubiquitin-like domain-containing protein 1 [Haliotis rufescens]